MALPVRPEWAFRLPSMVFFCLGVLTVGLIGRRFGDPVTGGLAAILLAWNPLALNEIRIARCYGLVVFEASLLLWITLAWWQRPRDARVALAFAIVTSILAWTHYLAVLFACTCGAALVMIPRRRLAATPRRRRTPLGLIAVVVSITTLACLPLIPSLTRLRHWSPLMELQSVPPNLLDVAGPVWFAGLPALLIAAMALRRPELYAENSFELHLRPLLVISGCISLSSLVVFLAFGIWGPHSLASNPRYQVAFTVAVSLFLAATARQLTGRLRRPTSGALFAGAVSVVGTWLVVGASPLAPTRLTTVAASEWKQAAQIATEHSEDNDLILVQSGLVESAIVPYLFSDQLFMEYVACRMGRFYLPDRRTRLAL